MTQEEVMTSLRDFIRTKFDVPDDDPDFTDDVHIFDYGYVDSFGAVEIIGFLKETFDVTVSDTDLIMRPLNTVQEIGTFVFQRQAEA